MGYITHSNVDDMTVLIPTASALQQLLNICEEYAAENKQKTEIKYLIVQNLGLCVSYQHV